MTPKKTGTHQLFFSFFSDLLFTYFFLFAYYFFLFFSDCFFYFFLSIFHFQLIFIITNVKQHNLWVLLTISTNCSYKNTNYFDKSNYFLSSANRLLFEHKKNKDKKQFQFFLTIFSKTPALLCIVWGFEDTINFYLFVLMFFFFCFLWNFFFWR